jgi:hypothetical protein
LRLNNHLTHEECEDAYREALLCLAEFLSVREPFLSASGKRMCRVGGVPMEDEQVLLRWWGKEITELILHGHES